MCKKILIGETSFRVTPNYPADGMAVGAQTQTGRGKKVADMAGRSVFAVDESLPSEIEEIIPNRPGWTCSEASQSWSPAQELWQSGLPGLDTGTDFGRHAFGMDRISKQFVANSASSPTRSQPNGSSSR